MALADEGVIDAVGDGEETCAETGECIVVPKGLPSPVLPSKAEVEAHNLTHIPYRNWCPVCVAARRKNNPHYANREEKRAVPLLVADYCFPGEAGDEDHLTVLVGRVSPKQSLIAVPCDRKGHDDYTINRLAKFVKSEGISELVYKSDQERALCRLLSDVVTEATKKGDVFSAVPENSAVGESQSNGRAEAAVQKWEDHMRTIKAGLETRLGQKVPLKHPVVLWMIEHVSSLINRHFVAAHGKTPYEYVHGKRSKGRTAEFGERILYHVPKKLRSSLDLRWRAEFFLGTAPSSNEIYVGTEGGAVVKSRSMCRVVAEARWSADHVFKVAGTPMRPNPLVEGDAQDAWIEETTNPHESGDLDVELVSRPAQDSDDLKKRAAQRIRITKNDLLNYGYTSKCPKCEDLKEESALHE